MRFNLKGAAMAAAGVGVVAAVAAIAPDALAGTDATFDEMANAAEGYIEGSLGKTIVIVSLIMAAGYSALQFSLQRALGAFGTAGIVNFGVGALTSGITGLI